MATPRTGQLGTGALGSLWLGAPAIWTTAPAPPTVHARSAITAAGVKSAITAATVKGRIE